MTCAGCDRNGSILCDACAEGMAAAQPRAAPAPVERVVAALDYGDAARRLVLELKLTRNRAAAAPLADALWNAVQREGLIGRTLVWVPARSGDVAARGFDHAQLIARGLARRSGLRLVAGLKRSGQSVDQSRLGARQRWVNLAEAFVARTQIRGPVVLIDDLITTGATASACASALIEAGASSVELAVACSADGVRRGPGWATSAAPFLSRH